MTSFVSFRSARMLKVLKARRAALERALNSIVTKENPPVKTLKTALLLSVIAILTTLPLRVEAQSLVAAEDSSSIDVIAVPAHIDLTYTRPTPAIKLHNYLFDTFGPYPIVASAAIAGIGQVDHSPSEWELGASGYAKRFGSDFGIAAITTTTRYAMAEALKEDTLYYPCECRGVFPRLGHAVVSTVTARHGDDGHRAFSISAFAAPYAGTITAVYAWYPGSYGAKSALRMGNYNLLGELGENILLEFFHRKPHPMLTSMHLTNAHLAPGQPGE